MNPRYEVRAWTKTGRLAHIANDKSERDARQYVEEFRRLPGVEDVRMILMSSVTAKGNGRWR